jgi:toxin secretion/phage lysis holin
MGPLSVFGRRKIKMESLKALMAVSFRDDWWILLLPAACIAIDIITGVTNAWIEGNVKSYLLRKGLGKKGGEVLAIVLGELLVCGLSVPKELLSAMSVYIVFMEVISIFENLDKLGVPIPWFVKKALGAASNLVIGSENNELSEEVQEAIKDSINNKTKKGGANE